MTPPLFYRLGSDHCLKLLFGQRLNAELLSLCKLAARLFAYDEVIRVLRYRACGISTERDQLVLNAVAGVIVKLAGSYYGLAVEGIVCVCHSCDLLFFFKNYAIKQREPKLSFRKVCVPIVYVFVHGLTEIGKLREIEAITYCIVESLPRAVEVAFKISTCVSADVRYTKCCNEFSECTMTALLDRLNQSVIRLFSEPISVDDCFSVLSKVVQISEIANPTVSNELLQRLLRESLDVHSGLVTEMKEPAYQLCGTVRILTVKLSCSPRRGFHHERLSTAGTGHIELERVALRFV